MKSYDANLRQAMSEIEEILKKHDIGAFVSLHSRSHGEFKMCIETPTWSNARFVKNGDAVHIKLYMKSEHKKTEDTVAMLASMKDMAAMCFAHANQIMDTVEYHAKVEHIPFGKGGITNEDR